MVRSRDVISNEDISPRSRAGPVLGQLLVKHLCSLAGQLKDAPARVFAGRYAAACLSFAAATALTLVAGGNGGYKFYLPFCVAVIVSAWYGALVHGVVAALLSALSFEHVFNIPLSRTGISPKDFELVGVFALTAFTASRFNNIRRRSSREAGETIITAASGDAETDNYKSFMRPLHENPADRGASFRRCRSSHRMPSVTTRPV